MSSFQRIRYLSEKINSVIESVEKNGGNFSVIDKDMLTNYIRELYELTMGIQTIHTTPSKYIPENKPVERPNVNGFEKSIVNGEEQETHSETSKESAPRKSISEIYSGKHENGKTVNDKYKKQGLEIADKLKQTPIKDLKSYIGLNKQFAFMNKLFNGDEEMYEKAIATVNGFKSYEEATTYIQTELLSKLQWSDEEPLVGEFFMLVMRRYLN